MEKKDFLKLRNLIHSELNLWFTYSQRYNSLCGKCSDHLKLFEFCSQQGFNVVVFAVTPNIVVIYNNVC